MEAREPIRWSRPHKGPVRALGLAACLLVAGRAGAQPACDFSGVDAAVTYVVDGVPQLAGAGLRIGTADGALHEAYFGGYDAATVVRTASAAKLLSAAAVMSVVDDGGVGIDTPVSDVLPQFTGDEGAMTLRQMFSHTSGLPGGSDHPVLGDRTITLAQAVDEIACCIPPDAPPGVQFAYGGLSMHVGGRVAEVADGRPWDDLFAARIAGPLGMTATDYDGFGPTDNPRIAGGARTSLRDYALFLEMLLRGGVAPDGARVLGADALREIFADQRGGLPIVEAPPSVGDAGYGLGLWIESTDAQGAPLRVSDPGAFGFTPWIEMDRRVYGVLMVEWLRQPLIPAIESIQTLVREELDRCDARGPAVPALPAAGAPARALIAFALVVATARILHRVPT